MAWQPTSIPSDLRLDKGLTGPQVCKGLLLISVFDSDAVAEAKASDADCFVTDSGPVFHLLKREARKPDDGMMVVCAAAIEASRLEIDAASSGISVHLSDGTCRDPAVGRPLSLLEGISRRQFSGTVCSRHQEEPE